MKKQRDTDLPEGVSEAEWAEVCEVLPEDRYRANYVIDRRSGGKTHSQALQTQKSACFGAWC